VSREEWVAVAAIVSLVFGAWGIYQFARHRR
jgi:hypothetical protein